VINKEDLDTDNPPPLNSIVVNHEDFTPLLSNLLTKEHKTNMSLLFYDFNGSSTSNNNPKNCKKIMQAHPSQNIADLVIPEEDMDGGMPGNKNIN
jgi:hypothetical protein